MRKFLKACLYIVCVFALSSAAMPEYFTEYQKVSEASEMYKSYLYKDGAPRGTVYEDIDGYLWGLSGGGIYRFNGNKWQDMGDYLKKEDRWNIRTLNQLANKDIMLIVSDGIYRWLGYGFKKYKTKSSGQPSFAPIFSNNLFTISGIGYSVYENDTVSHHSNQDFADFYDTLMPMDPGSLTNLINFCKYHLDEEKKIWILDFSNLLKNSSDRKQKRSYLCPLLSFNNATVDTLKKIDFSMADHSQREHILSKDFGKVFYKEHKDILFMGLGDKILFGYRGADHYYQVDADIKAVKKVSLATDEKLQNILKNKGHDRIYLTTSNNKTLFLHEYKKENNKTLFEYKHQIICDKEFEQYVGVIVSIDGETYSIKPEDDFSGKINDYLIGRIDNGHYSRDYPEDLFRDSKFGKTARMQVQGSTLAVFDASKVNATINLRLFDLNNLKANDFVFPALNANSFQLKYSNDYFALVSGDDRLWRLEMQKAITQDIAKTLFPGMKKIRILAGMEPEHNMLATWDEDDQRHYYYLDHKQQFIKISDLPFDAHAVKYMEPLLYYLTANGKEFYVRNMKNNENFLLMKKDSFINCSPIMDAILLTTDEELSIVSEGKIRYSTPNSSLLDSLSVWSGDHYQSVLNSESLNRLVFRDGNLWSGTVSERIFSPLTSQSIGLILPSHKYDFENNIVSLQPEIISVLSTEGKVWFLQQEINGEKKLILKEHYPDLRENLLPFSLDEDEDFTKVKLFAGTEFPFINTQAGLWYYWENQWQLIPAYGYSKVGLLHYPLYHQGWIWLIGLWGVAKYSPDEQVLFVYDTTDGLMKYTNAAYKIREGILAISFDSKTALIRSVESGIKLSIPWLQEGTRRLKFGDKPVFKHQQNSFVIPIDIFNVPNPEKCSIKYQLRGYDKAIQTISFTDELVFQNLRPGRYSLDIWAYSPEGYKSGMENYLSFRILPPWWANIYAYIVYALSIALVLYLIYRNRVRSLKRQKEHLEDQVAIRTLELTEKQEKIQQSIESAYWIQSSILPLESEMRELMPNHFVIFKPRDIVSGDFYWLYREENYWFFALIDCTGHGVPGALISVSANSILHNLIKDRGIHHPADILNNAHLEIGHVLHQGSASNSQDGFEIALIRYQPSTREICYAGAKRPLYLFDGKELIKYPANNRSIGGLKWHQELYFDHIEIQAKAGDWLYFFTDGILDQPHPEYERKLGTQRWIELLTEYLDLDLDEQKAKLEGVLDQMLEYSEQRDDITIVGIELP